MYLNISELLIFIIFISIAQFIPNTKIISRITCIIYGMFNGIFQFIFRYNGTAFFKNPSIKL